LNQLEENSLSVIIFVVWNETKVVWKR